MLEYLFDFIESNIILIFICVLFFTISSIYSKKMKMFFIAVLMCATLYFALLLCLYRLGIGIDFLYCCSSKIIITVIEHMKCLFIFDFEHLIGTEYLSNIIFGEKMVDKFTISIFFVSSIIILPLIINSHKPLIINFECKKIKLDIKNKIFINKYDKFKKQISNLNMNCVLRC